MVFDGSSRGLERDVRHQKLEALAEGLGFVVGLRPSERRQRLWPWRRGPRASLVTSCSISSD